MGFDPDKAGNRSIATQNYNLFSDFHFGKKFGKMSLRMRYFDFYSHLTFPALTPFGFQQDRMNVKRVKVLVGLL